MTPDNIDILVFVVGMVAVAVVVGVMSPKPSVCKERQR
jgi:hypothetical protein